MWSFLPDRRGTKDANESTFQLDLLFGPFVYITGISSSDVYSATP